MQSCCGNKARKMFHFPNTPEKCSLFVYRWCCVSLEKELHFPMALWSPDGVSLGGVGPALGLRKRVHFGGSVFTDSKTLGQEQHSSLWYWSLDLLMLFAVKFKVVKQKQWSGTIMRAMPRAFQGRSMAAMQQSLSGLFRVRHFSCLCSFAHCFRAENQIREPFFTLFLNDNFWGQ